MLHASLRLVWIWKCLYLNATFTLTFQKLGLVVPLTSTRPPSTTVSFATFLLSPLMHWESRISVRLGRWTACIDRLFSHENCVQCLTRTANAVGVQGQVFTVVNDESYFYPDMIRGKFCLVLALFTLLQIAFELAFFINRNDCWWRNGTKYCLLHWLNHWK